MSTSTVGLFLRHLALSEEVGRLGVTSDHDLLATYEAERGQAAFTELMRRHGPMVLRTCRRVLGHGPDAEDAFQATFLLLARKAGQLGRGAAGRQTLGGWLHRVAYQTALNVLTQLTRRRVHERQAGPMSHLNPDPSAEATWNEVRPILDAELDALPEEARQLLIACYLQDKTHAEAAAELRLPLGSVAWRLEKARALLEERLVRRGIAISTSLMAILMGEAASGAGIPARLLVRTVEAARTFTEQAGALVSERVAQLVKGGLGQMTKSSTRLSVMLAGWVGLLGAGLIACQTLKAWPDESSVADSLRQSERARGASAPHAATAASRTDRYGDPLPPSALARLGTVRLRNAGAGHMSVLFTRDGKGVLAAGRSPAYLWEIPSGKPLRRFGNLSRQAVEAIALSPDGRVLAGRGGEDGGLRLWDVATGKLLAEGKGGPAHVVCLAFSPDGKRIASGGNDNKLFLWNAATGQEQWVQDSADGCVFAIAFSPDGKTLAAVDGHGISLWDAATGERRPQRWSQERPLSHPAFTADGRTLAVVCGPLPDDKERESVVCLVDVAALKEVRQLAPEKEGGIANALPSLALAPDGKVLAAANSSGEIRLWDTSTGKELRRCQGERSFANAMAFSADGKMLAGVSRGVVRLWETASGKEVHSTAGGHRHGVSSVAFTSDGRTLISSSWDGTVRLWDPATGEQRQHIEPDGRDRGEYQLVSEASAIAPDGKTITVVDTAWPIERGSFGAVVHLWDRDADRERSRFFQKLGKQLGNLLVLSPNGKTVACVRSDEPEEVQLWESTTGKLLSRIAGSCPAFSPDGKFLATVRGKQGKSVTLWETATAKELCSFTLPEGQVYRLAFSPEGRELATVSDEPGLVNKNAILLWPLLPSPQPLSPPGRGVGGEGRSDLRVGPPRVLAKGLSFWLWTLAFSPDGRMLALPDKDGIVRVLETASGKERARFTGHGGEVRALAFAPDGRRLASGSFDTTILIWDATGRLQEGRLRPARLSAKEQEALWIDLAADDAGRAGRALWSLAADPARTVPFLAKWLRPVPARVTAEAVAKLIRDLDDDAFVVRAKARLKLEKLSDAAEPALRQALEKASTLEVRRRLEELLAAIEEQRKSPSGEVLRELRAVEALEQIGTREARQVLKNLATGAPAAHLTQEAAAALARLQRAEKR